MKRYLIPAILIAALAMGGLGAVHALLIGPGNDVRVTETVLCGDQSSADGTSFTLTDSMQNMLYLTTTCRIGEKTESRTDTQYFRKANEEPPAVETSPSSLNAFGKGFFPTPEWDEILGGKINPDSSTTFVVTRAKTNNNIYVYIVDKDKSEDNQKLCLTKNFQGLSITHIIFGSDCVAVVVDHTLYLLTESHGKYQLELTGDLSDYLAPGGICFDFLCAVDYDDRSGRLAFGVIHRNYGLDKEYDTEYWAPNTVILYLFDHSGTKFAGKYKISTDSARGSLVTWDNIKAPLTVSLPK